MYVGGELFRDTELPFFNHLILRQQLDVMNWKWTWLYTLSSFSVSFSAVAAARADQMQWSNEFNQIDIVVGFKILEKRQLNCGQGNYADPFNSCREIGEKVLYNWPDLSLSLSLAL